MIQQINHPNLEQEIGLKMIVITMMHSYLLKEL